jgi:hypothetical protein
VTKDPHHENATDPVSMKYYTSSRYTNYDELPPGERDYCEVYGECWSGIDAEVGWNEVVLVVSMAPGAGEIVDVYDVGSAMLRGDFGEAAVTAGLALLPGSTRALREGGGALLRRLDDVGEALHFADKVGVDEVGDALRAADRAGVDEAASAGARHAPAWPNTAEEMDEFLGVEGRRIPDGPNTPGRNKVEWELSDNLTVTYEQHPYHPNAPEWHRGPHWHLDTPRRRHERYIPGDPIPGYR